MWKSLIDKFNGKGRKRGYTMTELLAVIGIIAVVVAIAIPSIFFISRTLKFKQRNDYAKTVFLAAQANLSEMRSDGSLFQLQTGCDSEAVPQGHCEFPDTEWSYEYVFASSEFPEPEGNTRSAFDTVLPVNSVESVVRKRNIIIEYNPLTGNVFAVFYCSDEILSQYREGSLPRDEEERKKLMLGYYDGSGLSSSELDLESSEAYMVFDSNGEEGILTVKVPVSESYYAHLNEFMEGLSIELTLTGDNFGGTIGPFMVDVSNGKIDVDGKTVMFDYTLDSLKDLGSFANLAAIDNSKHLSDYVDESEFVIKPGDNVRVKATVDFNGEIEVDVDDAFLLFNPMFDEMTSNSAGGFKVKVSNGRHLQNLNAIAPCVADLVSEVTFGDDIYWNETVDYYNNKYGVNVEGVGKVYRNNAAENPCRGLPYFVPIHNEYLFGTATFRYPDGTNNNGGIWGFIGDMVENILGSDSQITVAFKGNKKVPTLTDEMEALTPDDEDQSIAQGHAKIVGFNKRVYYLNIDSTKYTIPNVGDTGEVVDGVQRKLDGTYYATGVRQMVDYQFTGLFGYINTYISDLHVVNPIVKGNTFVDGTRLEAKWGTKWNGLIPEYTITGYDWVTVPSNPATGALVGAAGYNTWVVNCSVYLDTEDPYFNRAYMTHGDYVDDAEHEAVQNWYGVSGKGAVGGLIGYAKSHRTTNKTLDENDLHLAFRNCFAAVNVTGYMRGNDNSRHFGYSNGVGGLIGNSQLTNFFNCYASGNVKANGLYLSETTLDKAAGSTLETFAKLFGYELDMPYNGRTSIGVGGFVGTSHGTRYTRCFASGNVAGYGDVEYGAGGFVGIMSLDETFSYGNDSESEAEIAQTTIMTECYAVGRATCNGESGENFSGANARVNFNLNQTRGYLTNDYYRLYAPHYYQENRTAPGYEDTYIFRDSYYLSDYYDVSQKNSNNCATAELYSTFQDLVGAHATNTAWKTDHINKIKDIKILDWGILEPTYGLVYFTLRSELNDIYKTLYAEGYQTGWGPATEQTTHSYSMNAAGARYPFTKLENLDYYGDWPGVPSSAGLAYYETYLEKDGTESDIRIYFDRDNTSELATDPNTVVYRDGYAVLTAGKGVVKVEVGDKTFSLRGKKVENTNQYTPDDEYEPNDAFYPGDDTYHVYLMTDEIMEAAMQESIKTGEFYVKVTITDPQNTSKKYVTYFNPAVALTQVNPVKDSSDETSPANYNAVKPSTIPSQLNVRSARQLAALSRNKHLWGEDFHYVQQFHIDAASYKWPEGTSMEIGSIGTDKDAFKGTYQGNGGYVTQAKISGFEPTKGFFGSVANTGKIINLDITVGELTVGSKNDTNVGILAGSNGGIIDNVDLKIEGDVTLTAKNAAGLLVGRNVGSSAGSDKRYPASITNCTVTGQNAAINANNAGGLAGEAKGENRLNLTSFTDNVVKLTELTSTGGMVGGMFGSAEMVTVTNSDVETRLNAENALYAGGFAGGLYDGTVTTMVVTLTGDSSAEGTLAGLVGYAAGTNFTAADLEFKKTDSLTADVVAGAFGVADSVNVKNSSIDLKNKDLNGTSGAAGYAYQILGDSVVQMVNVPLTGGSVTATEGKAAGFAVENAGSIASSVVKLGSTKTGGENPDKDKKNGVAITGGTEAVGFAGTVSGSISNCSVSGFGSITADGRAAGFAGDVTGSIGLSYVTPAYNDHKDYYNGNSNDNLPVKAATVAGFALSVGEEGEVYGCYTLCKLNGSAYGFTMSNAGTISESTSNVTQTGGVSFVGENSGWINNCYGWYGNGKVSNKAPVFNKNSGKITSSYFANINDREAKVDLYDYTGKLLDDVAPSQITEEHLNIEDHNVWTQGASGTNTYAYTSDLRPGFYPYPRLRIHRGDWVREIQYAYGVIYYEKYSDGDVAYHVVDLSDHNETVEGVDMTKEAELRGNEVEITEAGYALFYNKEKCPFNPNWLGTEFLPTHPLCVEMGERYKINELSVKDRIKIEAQVQSFSGESSIEVLPHFADAIGYVDVKEYQVRSPEQLGHVGDEAYQNKGITFKQTHDIAVNELQSIKIFGSNYITDDNSTLKANSAPNGWMQKVNQNANVNLTRLVVDEVGSKNPIFGEIEGTVEIKQLDIKDAAGMLVDGIYGGTLTGDAINIGGEIKHNLVGSLNKKATLSGFEVTSAGVTASLIGSTAGTVSDIDLFCKEESTINGSGILAGAVTGGTIEKCDLTMGTVNTDMESFQNLDEEKNQLAFGAIAAKLPAEVTFTDNTVSAEINVTGEDDKLAVVGGLVGYSEANITGGSADVIIHYTQTKSDMVGIGGLVAWVNDGSITGTNVTGSIELDGIATDRTGYYIGGAIAYDGGAAYSDMVSTVIVDPAWAGCAPTTEATIYSWETEGTNVINPSGAGPVGKFVGYVTSGVFTDCTAIDNAQSGDYNLQFLGEIHPVPVKLTDRSYGYVKKPFETSVVHTSQEYPAGTDVSLDEWLDISSDLRFEAGTEFRIFNATMTNCYFDYPDSETLKQQRTDMANLYFFQASPQETVTNYSAQNAAGVQKFDLQSFSADQLTRGTKLETSYYYKHTDGKYYKAYVTYEFDYYVFYWRYEVKIYIDVASDGITNDNNAVKSISQNYSNPTVDCLYTLEAYLDGDTDYLITDETVTNAYVWDGDHAVTTHALNETFSFNSDSPLYNGIWYYNSDESSFCNKAGKYLTASSNNFSVSDTARTGLTLAATIPNGYEVGTGVKYAINNNANHYLYAVTEGTHWYRATFGDTGLFNHICGYQNTDLAKTEFVPEEVLEVLNVEEEDENEKSSTRKEKSKTTAEKTSGGAKRKKNK